MSAISRVMRSKFGGIGEDDEDDDEGVKREMEENEPRTKHSIDGILGDRCKFSMNDFIKRDIVVVCNSSIKCSELRECWSVNVGRNTLFLG